MRLPEFKRHPSDSITAAVVLLGTSLAARLWLAASLGMQKDEAFYAVWARAPDAAYAWLPLAAIRATVSLLGETALAVRLPFALAMTAAGAAAFSLARTLTGSAAAAAWTVALLLGNVWAHFGGAQAHPDAFLAACWIGALAVLTPRERSRAAVYVGAALAAGAALSKYTGFLLWPAWLIVEIARRRGPHERPRDLPLATLTWFVLVAPAAAAILGENAHWLRTALGLADWGDRVPLGVRLALLPLLPLAHLAVPGAAVFAVGPFRAWRAGLEGRAMLWLGAAMLLVFTVVAVRGSLKGNWLLPALWGTLPLGVAWFLEGVRRKRWLFALVAVSVLVTALVHAAALRPDVVDRLASRLPALAAIDRGYDTGISPRERRYSTSRRWLDRAYEWHVSAALADSLRRRAGFAGRDLVVASDLYEVVYAMQFHGPRRTARIMQDRRFQNMPEFVRGSGNLPDRVLYVTAPGVELPEPFFLWYGFLEREPRLDVPVGGGAVRSYEVWKCGRSRSGW